MKKFLQFSGLIALVVAIIGFILMMSTHSLEYVNGNAHGWYDGTSAIFGSGKYLAGWGGLSVVDAFNGNLAWNALLAWIFALVAMLILCLGVVLPLLKVKALEKWAGLLNLIAVGLLIVGGIFMFFTVPSFASANEFNTDHYSLGAGWVIGGILFIIAGALAIAPAAADFLGKKKK